MLRRSNLGEADRIVTLYTREYGKRRAVAKSVRRSKSRLAGHIELFTHVDVYSGGRGMNLDVLTQATAIETFPTMSDDLDRFAKASWAAEVVDRLTLVGEPDPELFALLLATIRLLASQDERRSIHLRQFELHALKRLGYQAASGVVRKLRRLPQRAYESVFARSRRGDVPHLRVRRSDVEDFAVGAKGDALA